MRAATSEFGTFRTNLTALMMSVIRGYFGSDKGNSPGIGARLPT